MKIKNIFTRPRFDKKYKKLRIDIKKKAKAKEKIFRNDPFDPQLKTHKLHGKEKGSFAFWVNYEYRIKFVFLNGEEVLFLDIGRHDIYK